MPVSKLSKLCVLYPMVLYQVAYSVHNYTYTNTEMTENLREILTFLIFYRCVC